MIAENIQNAQQIREKLLDSGEYSLAITFEGMMQKYFALSVSSSFEHRIVHAILNYAEKHSDLKKYNYNIIRVKAVSRQYHTFFNWQQKNANSFFTLFGQNCKEKFLQDKKIDQELQQAEADFLELGRLRNELVHEDFITFPFPLTLQEIKEKYDSAMRFISYVEETLD